MLENINNSIPTEITQLRNDYLLRIQRLEKSNKAIKSILFIGVIMFSSLFLLSFQNTRAIIEEVLRYMQTNKVRIGELEVRNLKLIDGYGDIRSMMYIDTVDDSPKLIFTDVNSMRNKVILGLSHGKGFYALLNNHKKILFASEDAHGGLIETFPNDSTSNATIQSGFVKGRGYSGIWGNQSRVFYVSDVSSGGLVEISTDDSLVKSKTKMGILNGKGFYQIWGGDKNVFLAADSDDGGTVVMQSNDRSIKSSVSLGIFSGKGFYRIWGGSNNTFLATEDSYGGSILLANNDTISPNFASINTQRLVITPNPSNDSTLFTYGFGSLREVALQTQYEGIGISSRNLLTTSGIQQTNFGKPNDIMNLLINPISKDKTILRMGKNIQIISTPEVNQFVAYDLDRSTIAMGINTNRAFIETRRKSQLSTQLNSTDSTTTFQLFDGNGLPRLSLGNIETMKNKQIYMNPVSTIYLFDDKGASTFMAPLLK